MAYAATNDPRVNESVLNACREHRVLCGIVDSRWREGDLISPAVLFSSGSAMEAFVDQWGSGALNARVVAAIGPATEAVLTRFGIREVVVPHEATVEATVLALAGRLVSQSIEEDYP